VAAAEAAGADTLVTCGGLQSNHCRATALVAARRGLRCHLVLRGERPSAASGNLFLALFAGATVSWIDADRYRRIDEVFDALSASLQGAGHRPWIIPEGASDPLGTLGYIRAQQELVEGWGDGPPFTHIAHACGSGGTAAGLALGAARFGVEAEILSIAVCDDATAFRARIGALMAATSARYPELAPSAPLPTIIDRYVGAGYGLTCPAQRSAMLDLSRCEGVVLDPSYSGKAWFGLRREIEAGRLTSAHRVLFVHTGGVFGLLADGVSFSAHLGL